MNYKYTLFLHVHSITNKLYTFLSFTAEVMSLKEHKHILFRFKILCS